MSKKIFERTDERHCWVIKSTRGGPGEEGEGDYWEKFLQDNIVAIGWPELDNDPRDYTYDDFLSEVRACYPEQGDRERDKNPGHIATTIYSFGCCWQSGDKAIISEGYTSLQYRDVLVRGVATVGDFFFDPQPKWLWRFKRNANLVPLNVRIPKSVFVEAFGCKSMRQTIHGPFALNQLEKFTKVLQE
jgi:hypothetical protein